MDTSQRILEKSHELFLRFGVRSVSMDDIASQLGISKKTVYQYYNDKGGLVDAVFSMMMESNRANCLVAREKRQNAIDEVFRSFDMVKELLTKMHPSVMLDLQKYHPATFQKFLQFKHEFLYRMVRENLELGMEEGLYRGDIDTDILSRYRLFSILLSFDSSVFPSNRTDLVYIEQQLLEHFLYGVATPKGQKLVQKYIKQRVQQHELS